MPKASASSGPARLAAGVGVFVLLVAFAAVVAVAVHYSMVMGRPALREGQSTTVAIPAGSNWSAVVEILAAGELVRYPRYFDFWARRRGLPERAKAGTFRLQGPLSWEELQAALEKGGLAEEVTVTVPEGLTIFHLADLFAEKGLIERDDLLRAARDTDALTAAGVSAESFEGYLFPDTYRFAMGSSAEQVVQRMHARFVEVWGEVSKSAPDPLAQGLSRHEVVTLASVVERETGAASERPLIARVFHNRLARKMKLQSDPTCVYSAQRYQAVPTPADCKDKLNRYSTYVVDGLPPGPIASPGRAAIDAVLRPETAAEAAELLYFVAKRDGSGTHHFSRTHDEHRAAIDKYLR